jgi:hypothetical protein
MPAWVLGVLVGVGLTVAVYFVLRDSEDGGDC